MGPSSETYAKVGSLSVKAAGGASNVTTTESGLAAFQPTQYRRIAGMNTNPEIEWVPVTDADYTYKVRVLIGYTPTDTFDDYGSVILQPVYAAAGQVSVTFVDTFGDSHVVSTDDSGYAAFTDTKFNTAGKQITAKAVRGPWVSEGEGATTVIDITPPKPAKVSGDKVTNATKQLLGTNAEPNAKIFVSINGGSLLDAGTVAADGSWTYNLSNYLTKDDKVTIYLQDNAGAAPEGLSPAAPSTNSTDGNINPSPNALNYRDAIFQPATVYTVADVIPDKPSLVKSVESSGGDTTSVGDTLTYKLVAGNGKADSEDWKNVVIKDKLEEGLSFDETKHKVTINGVVVGTDKYEYDSSTRTLSIKVGDLASSGDTQQVTVTFEVLVEQSAVDQDIQNTASAAGDSPQEDPFTVGPVNPETTHKVISKDSNTIGLPGGPVFGILQLVSAPDTIDFKTAEVGLNDIRITNPEIKTNPLVVSDNRGTPKSWDLSVTMTKEMTNTEDDSKVLRNALHYKKNGQEDTLVLNDEYIILTHTLATQGTYNVSDTWSPDGDGFKLEVGAGTLGKLGEYTGELLWQLKNTP